MILSNFKKSDGHDNMPGFYKIQFIPARKVLLIPEHNQLNVEVDIELKPGSSWYEGEFIVTSSNFGDKDQSNQAGTFRPMELQGYYPGATPARTWNFHKIRKERYFIVLFYENNGYVRILGSLENPAEFFYEEANGILGAPGGTGYNISFKAVSDLPALYYQAEATVTDVVTIFYPDGSTVYATREPGENFTIPENMEIHTAVVASGATTYTHADLIGKGTTDEPTDMVMFLDSAKLEWKNPSAGKNTITAYNPTTGQITFKSALPSDTVFTAIIKQF